MKRMRIRNLLLVVLLLALGYGVVYAAATTVTPTTVSLTEQAPTFNAIPTDGLYFTNDGEVLLYFKNTGYTTPTITIVTPCTFGGLALADVDVTVGPITYTNEVIVGPFPSTWFNESSGTYRGKCKVTSSISSTAVTVAAIGW